MSSPPTKIKEKKKRKAKKKIVNVKSNSEPEPEFVRNSKNNLRPIWRADWRK
jgi:hypothetical protein